MELGAHSMWSGDSSGTSSTGEEGLRGGQWARGAAHADDYGTDIV